MWRCILCKCVLTCSEDSSFPAGLLGLKSWSDKGPVNVWLTDNCQSSMGWIKMERRPERTLTCWHVLLSAFQGGFNLFAPLWSDTTDRTAKWGPTVLEAAGELYSHCLQRDSRRGFVLRVSGAAVDLEEVQGFRRALSLTKQTWWNLCYCWSRGLSDRAAEQGWLSEETPQGQSGTIHSHTASY